MKKFLTGFVATALLLSLLTLSAGANKGIVDNDGMFSEKDFIKDTKHIAMGESYSVPENGVLRVEKGAVLYVYGNLSVKGTLKNYGKIIIGDGRSGKVEYDWDVSPGNISVSGTFLNEGTVEISAANMFVSYTGTLENSGTIKLKNHTNPDITLLYISGMVTDGCAVRKGLLDNTKNGIISTDISQGKGLVVNKNATFNNEGSYAKESLTE